MLFLIYFFQVYATNNLFQPFALMQVQMKEISDLKTRLLKDDLEKLVSAQRKDQKRRGFFFFLGNETDREKMENETRNKARKN